MRRFSLVVLIGLSLSSCYRASIQLQEPRETVTSSDIDDSMHFSLLGVVELSDAVDLETSCASGAVAIKEKISFTGGIINALLGTYVPVLQVMNPTVECDAEAP